MVDPSEIVRILRESNVEKVAIGAWRRDGYSCVLVTACESLGHEIGREVLNFKDQLAEALGWEFSAVGRFIYAFDLAAYRSSMVGEMDFVSPSEAAALVTQILTNLFGYRISESTGFMYPTSESRRLLNDDETLT
jgi:hypothetical protein